MRTRVILILILAPILLTACRGEHRAKTSPRISNGVLDLRGWDFQNDGPVALSGEWEFRWGRFLHEADASGPAGREAAPTAPAFITVPGAWGGHDSAGNAIPAQGHASYRLRVLLDTREKHLALAFLNVHSAFRAFVDGVPITAAGAPGPTGETTIPELRPHQKDFMHRGGPLAIVVQVSNFHYYRGGIWDEIRLGLAADIQEAREKSIAVDLLTSGSIFIMGLYHLVLFMLRRKDRSTLHFGIFCLLIALRVLLVNERYFSHLFPSCGYELNVKLEFLTFYLGLPAFCSFCYSLFEREYSKNMLLAVWLMGIAFSALVVFAPARISGHSLLPYQAITVVYMAYTLAVFILAVFRKREGAGTLLAGSMLFFICIIHDILLANQLIHDLYWSSYGLFVYILFQSYILSKRFSRAFLFVESLTDDLNHININLERTIIERTEALQQSEELYRLVLENINDSIFICTLDGHLKYMSPSIARITGYSPDEMIGRHYLHFIHRDWRERELAQYQRQVRETIEVTEHEYPFVTRDGGIVWVEQTVRMVKPGEGPVEFFGVMRDISARKDAEDALRESEEKYRHFIENAHNVIYKADWRGNFLFANEAFTRLLGYTNDEIKRLNYLDLIPPWRRDEEYAFYRGQLRQRIGQSTRELPVLTTTGAVVWVEQSVKAIFREDGTISEFDAILHDVTDRKKAEEALRESEELHRLILENVEDGVFTCGIDGRFTYVNRAIERISGYTFDDFMRRGYLHFVHRDDRERELKAYVAQVIENIPITYHEYRFIHKDGSVIWISQTTRMVRNSAGKTDFYGIARDMTKKKQAEQAHRELEEQKTRFFTNISHEIRTPLTLILSPIESVLQNDDGTPVTREFLLNIQQNGNRLLHLINDLLDVAKIEEGRMQMHVREVDIVRMVENYVTILRSAAEAKNIRLTFTAGAGIAPVYLDPEKFEKIIMNLFSNAFKFTDTSGSIDVQLYEDDDRCHLAVADTGIGIPASMLAGVFDRFRQADTGLNRRYEGTGIGLSLVKEFVEMHGGSVAVRSRYIDDSPDDHGSVFTVAIPRGKAHLQGTEQVTFVAGEASDLMIFDRDRSERIGGIYNRAESAAATEHARTADDESFAQEDAEKKTILIVDDNRDMVRFLVSLLGNDYHTLSAATGKEALSILNAGQVEIDLLLADVMMPEMDGHELAKHVRADERFSGLPVVFLTARSDSAMKLDAFKAGAVDYITKPFHPGELLSRVHVQLELKQARDRLARANRELYAELERSLAAGKRPLMPETREKIERIIEFLNEHYTADISREGLAAAVDFSPDHLSRLFKEHTGRKISEYINELRIRKAAEQLKSTSDEIIVIARAVGFDCLRTFNRSFQKIMGSAPSDFRKKNSAP